MNQKIYKYDINVKVIFTEDSEYKDKSYEINSRNVVNLSVSNDYLNTLYPVTFLQFSLSERDYYFILENKNDVRLLITLTAYLVEDSSTLEEYLSKKVPYGKNIVMQKVFRMYFDDVSPYNERKIHEEDPLKTDTSEFKVLSTYLFAEDNLEKNKHDINFVLNNLTISDALIYICNKSKVTDLIFKDPDNTKVYEQILCPPLKLKQSVKHLQENYGIYNEGSFLYQDFKRTYLLPKSFKEATTEEKEVDKVYILLNDVSGENSNMNITSSYNEKYEAYMISTFNNIKITNNANFDKEIVGDKITIINANNTNEDNEVMEIPLNSYVSSNGVTKNKNVVYYNDNKYTITEYYHDIINNQIIIDMELMNIDVSYITPNKEYVLLFENSDDNKKYGGNYNIKSFVYSISRDLGGAVDFQLNCQLRLNKVMY